MKTLFTCFFLAIFNLNCDSQTYSSERDIELPKSPIKSDLNDTWNNNIYSNNLYRFKIEFPKNWEYDNGASDMTLARAGNREIGASFSIQVIQLPGEHKNKNDIWVLSEEEISKLSQHELETIKDINEFKVEKGYLSESHAYLVEFEYAVKSGKRSFTYLSKQVRCIKKGIFYQVTFNIPINFYKDDMEIIYNRIVDSFRFI